MPKKRISLNMSFEINGFGHGDPVKKARRRFIAAIIGVATAAVSLIAHYVQSYDVFIGTPPSPEPAPIEEIYKP